MLYCRGHGTFIEDGHLVAGVAGTVERVSKLVSVKPLNARYTGEVGDVVVGRVREVGNKRWRVDVGGRQDAVLQLSSINLSGGEQRRRTFEDQMAMRTFFKEEDLLSAEVHSVHADGSLSLHARSLKYGRLVNGLHCTVPCSLMRRLQQHFQSLPCGVDCLLGMNGYIWITATLPLSDAGGVAGVGADGTILVESTSDAVEAEAGIAEAVEKRKALAASRLIDGAGREKMARVRNSILALANALLPITPANIMFMYDTSAAAGCTAADLMSETVQAQLTSALARQQDEDA